MDLKIMRTATNVRNNFHPAPQRRMPGDVGYDLYCTQDVTLASGERANVPCDVAFKIIGEIWLLIMPRSSVNAAGLHVYPGVIDQGYRGPIWAYVANSRRRTWWQDILHVVTLGLAYRLEIKIKAGDRIIQVIPLPILRLPKELEFIPYECDTERGDKGFGSTSDALTTDNDATNKKG